MLGAGLQAIGNTPLIKLNTLVPDGAAEVWVKLEGGNPTGSYKDRMAISVLRTALEQGDVKPGERVVEYTGGSTGTAIRRASWKNTASLSVLPASRLIDAARNSTGWFALSHAVW